MYTFSFKTGREAHTNTFRSCFKRDSYDMFFGTLCGSYKRQLKGGTGSNRRWANTNTTSASWAENTISPLNVHEKKLS